MKQLVRLLIGIACLTLALGAAAQDPWIHVSVDGHGPDAETVRVNVPLRLVTSVLPMVEDEALRNGRLHLDHHDMDGIDLPGLLRELRNAPEAEFVTVRNADESVRVAKEGDRFVIRVEEHGERPENVRVTVPLQVLDALLEGSDGEELDLIAALKALGEFDGDLVTVEGSDQTVRIWIDDRNFIAEE